VLRDTNGYSPVTTFSRSFRKLSMLLEVSDMKDSEADLPLSIPGNERAFTYYPPLRRVKEYIEKNWAEPITLSDAARVAAMEASYFSTFFHSKIGIPFSDWLRRIRVAKAIEMIQEEDRSICDVAFAVGFNDLRTFGRAFKRYTQSTPMNFKKACRP